MIPDVAFTFILGSGTLALNILLRLMRLLNVELEKRFSLTADPFHIIMELVNSAANGTRSQFLKPDYDFMRRPRKS